MLYLEEYIIDIALFECEHIFLPFLSQQSDTNHMYLSGKKQKNNLVPPWIVGNTVVCTHTKRHTSTSSVKWLVRWPMDHPCKDMGGPLHSGGRMYVCVCLLVTEP